MNEGSIGYKIKYYRKKAKLNQLEFAKLIGLNSREAIYKMESGQSFPAFKTLIRISEVLNVSVDDLITDYLTSHNSQFEDISDFLYKIYEDLPTLDDIALDSFAEMVDYFLEMKKNSSENKLESNF